MLDFFDKYRVGCEEFNRGPIHIPRADPENGVPGKGITLMFINERPGRVGPGRSDLISFENPDPTAYRFKRLFETLDIARKNIFIMNTCIYYPLRKDYHDTPPSTAEFNFSIGILHNQIRRVNPKIIVPMGNNALRALKKLFPESSLQKFSLKNDIGKSVVDTSPYIIFPLYHTSNRAAMTRNEKDQRKDWNRLKKTISAL